MVQLEITGGARIGFANATWPLATLIVTKYRLDINATIVGNCSFTTNDIISIEPCSGLFSKGIKINHRVEAYKNKEIIFWTNQKFEDIINSINEVGFVCNSPSPINEDVIQRQNMGTFPIKRASGIVISIIWILLSSFLLIDFFNFKEPPSFKGIIPPFIFILTLSILILISKKFRNIILKKGRTIKDIDKVLYFILGISLLVLLGLII